MMFSRLTQFDVGEEDMQISLTNLFGERPQAQWQISPATNTYCLVNADEADRILVDPAYKLERTKELEEKVYAML